MTTKMRRSFKSNENRFNYAKRAKDFGLEYISIANIQKYFKEDWEKIIESSDERFDWEYITGSLIREDLMKTQFSDIINELQREGLPIAEIIKLKRKYRVRIRRGCCIVMHPRQFNEERTRVTERID